MREGHDLRLSVAACIGMSVIALTTREVPASERPKPVGVLLGLQAPTGLRTLWIVGQGGTVQVSREFGSVVVPHGPRLCRLSVQSMDNVDPRLGETFTHAAVGLDCGEGVRSNGLEVMEGCGGGRHADVLFVSSTHVSLDVHEDGHCWGKSFHRNELMVLPTKDMVGSFVVDPVAGLDFDSLGESATAALLEAAVSGCKASDPELQSLVLPEGESCSQVGLSFWGIARILGQWVIAGRTMGWARGNDLDYMASVPLPPPIHSWARSTLSPLAVQAMVRDVEDFVTSPDNALAVVLRPEVIQAAKVKDGRLVLGEVLARKQKNERIVSIEWATGPNVARWTALGAKLEAIQSKRTREE